jgi:hypothetical protein
MKLRLWLTASASTATVALAGFMFAQHGGGVARAAQAAPGPEASTPPAALYRSAVPPEARRAFFGELHLHTTMSFDAWSFGTKVTPDQAYRFARGETVTVPAAQVQVEQGLQTAADVPARRAWPLDFAAVTDHSEFLGALHQLDDPNSAFLRTSTGHTLSVAGRRGFEMTSGWIYNAPNFESQEMAAAAAAGDGWGAEMRAANANYQPGRFTTFVAYEWTAMPRGLRYGSGHRNVIFNSAYAPPPFTAVQSSRPEDLWRYLDSVRKHGIDVLAIPHNSNLSAGLDFDWNMSDGRPIDEAYAQERALNEPLVEIAQIKGSSDTAPELSPADEFANFEIFDRSPNRHGSYVREAYGRGLVIQSRVGVNPFKMGIVGASDIHNGLSASSADAFAGGSNGLDPATMLPTGDRARAALTTAATLNYSNAAITGVWAEENTRNSIFAALKRKETFATTGVRIRVRMFGGWNFSTALLRAPDWVRQAYAQGVPMGSDLPAEPASATAPTFVLQAQKDPDGANLDRIQLIKVWLDHGEYKERVFDVALSGGRRDDANGHAPAVGNTVDLATGAYRNSIGAVMLTTVWRDPTFDPNTAAVYYARVLQIPTPRWSTLLAIKSHLPLPTGKPATIQERAWTSPIWFTPPPGAAHASGAAPRRAADERPSPTPPPPPARGSSRTLEGDND